MLSLISVIIVLLFISGSTQTKAPSRRQPRQAFRLTDKQIHDLSLQVSQLTQKVSSIEQQVQSALHPALPRRVTQTPEQEATDLQMRTIILALKSPHSQLQ